MCVQCDCIYVYLDLKCIHTEHTRLSYVLFNKDFPVITHWQPEERY